MKEINRELFEAWLFSQPLERKFHYVKVDGSCAICCFVKETIKIEDVWGGSRFINGTINGTPIKIPVPSWWDINGHGERYEAPLSRCHNAGTLTIANMQRRYIEMFGDPCIVEPSESTSVKALHP